MNRIRFIFFIWALCGSPALIAQNYNQFPWYLKGNSVWTFGNRAGVNFNSGTPVAFQSMINSNMGAASVSDPLTGALLFYSDGNWVYNRSNGVMPNGHQLQGNRNSVRQGVCIVPFVDEPGKYYLFSLSNFSPTSVPAARGRLFYSVVDMNRSNGYGDVLDSFKNILLDSMLGAAMIAVPGNNCDIWLVLHEAQRPVFKAYRITAAGISDTPVTSVTGGIFQGTNAHNHNCMAISPDRSKIAITFMHNVNPYQGAPSGGALLCTFDPNTGMVSNDVPVEGSQGCATLCFSPDNSKLYVSAYEDAPPNMKYMIYQYDVSSHNPVTIAATKTFIKQTISSPSDLKLYNDTIYAPTGFLITSPWQGSAFKLYLDRISHPNLAGTACNYEDTVVSLYNGTFAAYTLPNNVVYPLATDTVYTKRLDTLVCLRAGRSYRIPAKASYARAPLGYEWSDGSTDSMRLLTEPGVYWVISKNYCTSYVDSFIIRSGILTPFSLGRDTLICGNAPLLLRGPEAPGDYRWHDGGVGSDFEVTESGKYWLEIDDGGCISSDTIHVDLLDVSQDIGADVLLCMKEVIDLRLDANIAPGSSALWSDGSAGDAFLVSDTGTYWVTVTNSLCTGSDTMTVRTEFCDCIFELPGAFTPNGDGKNDLFRPIIEPGCPVNEYQMHIFNRWGERVYLGNDPVQGWDGTQRGIPAETGAYMYLAEFQGGTRGSRVTRKGDVMLIR